MAYEHYQFTIAAMGCLSQKDDNRGPALDQPSYKQCMCEAGMASYCPSATTTASAGAEPTRDPLSVMQSLLEEQLRDALESINSNSLFPENDEFHPDPDPDPYPADVDWSGTSSGIELGSGFTWVSLLVLIAFCICLMYRCKYGRGSQEGDNGQEGTNERRQNLDRPAEAGYGTTATDSGGGGGGGSWGGDSGAAQVAPPTDPPPPYELVYSGDTQPPPYEVACQEKAMATSDHPV